MPKILHYRDKCIGCNICYEIWPVRWRLSRVDGKCTLVNGIAKKGVWQTDISTDEVAINEKVALACPVKVIRIVKN
ncbi:MAG: ferredoxin [Taibaiella sp.]|nr:ferredoxin [Taibaiella sp.]